MLLFWRREAYWSSWNGKPEPRFRLPAPRPLPHTGGVVPQRALIRSLPGRVASRTPSHHFTSHSMIHVIATIALQPARATLSSPSSTRSWNPCGPKSVASSTVQPSRSTPACLPPPRRGDTVVVVEKWESLAALEPT